MNYDKLISIISFFFSLIAMLLLGCLTGLLKWMSNGRLQETIGIAVMLVWIIVLSILMTLLFVKAVSYHHRAERTKIVREYERTKDADQFYSDLTSMKNPPRLQFDKAALAFNLSTALSAQGKTDEALKKLDEIETENTKLKSLIETQRAEILAEAKSGCNPQ